MECYDSPEPLNIGTGQEIAMKDLAQQISEVVGYQGRIIWDTSKPNGQPRRCLDVTRAKNELQWTPIMPFDEGLKATYEDFLERL